MKKAVPSSAQSGHEQERSAAGEGQSKKGSVGYASPLPPVPTETPAQFKKVEVGSGADKTSVEWTEGTLKGSTDKVGMKMLAVNLHSGNVDKDGLVGTPPKSGAQKNLMSMLPTNPKLKTSDKYVRGHLLNHNIGGPGEDYNLFPITGSANSAHCSFVETDIKNWVSDGKHVDYQVDVESVLDQSDTGAKKGKVDATFSCIARNRDDNVKLSKDIVSTFSLAGIAKDNATKKFSFDSPTDKFNFPEKSWLGSICKSITDVTDITKVDAAVDEGAQKMIDKISEKIKEKDAAAKQILIEMFKTKGARFTANQKQTVFDVTREVIHAYIINNDKKEQDDCTAKYPALVKILTAG